MHFCQHTSRLPTHGIVQTTTHLPETTLPNALAAGLHTQQLQQGAFLTNKQRKHTAQVPPLYYNISKTQVASRQAQKTARPEMCAAPAESITLCCCS